MATTTASNVNFTQTNSTSTATVSQPMGSEIQDLIMHHQNHSATATAGNLALNSNYHHFGDPSDFHHHNHAHNIHNQILASGHNQRTSGQHHNNVVNHHMLTRTNHSTATSTAAAVAAAMMLDPRFHHNSSVSKGFFLSEIRDNCFGCIGSLSSDKYTGFDGNGSSSSIITTNTGIWTAY